MNIEDVVEICLHLSLARQALTVSSPATDALAQRIGEVEGSLNPNDVRYVGDTGAAMQALGLIVVELDQLKAVRSGIVFGSKRWPMPERQMPTLLPGVVEALDQLGNVAHALGPHV